MSEEEWRDVRGREIAMIFQEPMTSLNPLMRSGQFLESGPAERILREPASAYTRELLAAVPEIPRLAGI